MLLKKLVVRNDSSGHGHYEASRGGVAGKHEGVDYLVTKGEPVFAPEDVKIIRQANPYKSDPKYKGLLMKGLSTGYYYKIFYVIPDYSLIGKEVPAGKVIATAQAISEKYSSKMKDHIHVEVRTKNTTGKKDALNPENVFSETKSPPKVQPIKEKLVAWTNDGTWTGKTIKDLWDDEDFIGYGSNQGEVIYTEEYGGATNNSRIWAALSQEQKDEYGEYNELKLYPLSDGVTLLIPIQSVSAITSANSGVSSANPQNRQVEEYSSNITIMKGKEGRYYPKVMKYVTLDPGYVPTFKNRGIDVKQIYPRLRVYMWSRVKYLENRDAFLDITPYVESLSTSSTMDGSEFSIKLAPVIGVHRSESTTSIGAQHIWSESDVSTNRAGEKIMMGNINKRVTFKDSRMSGSLYIGSEYVRSNLFHEKIIQQNDMFFIKFEQLDSDVDKDMYVPEKIGKGWYDMIGLVDRVPASSSAATTDVSINITGRDLTKAMIEDNTYFNPYSIGHAESIYGGDIGSNGRYLSGAFQDLAAISARTVRQSLEFIFHRISSIGYVPDDIFNMFSDKTEVSVVRNVKKSDQDTQTSEVKRARGVWQIVKFWIDDNIQDLRLVDDSIANPQGSIWELMKKVCQAPFIELFTETIGSTFYVIARKPPFEQKILSEITGALHTDVKDGGDYRLENNGFLGGSLEAGTAYEKYLDCISKKNKRYSRPSYGGLSTRDYEKRVEKLRSTEISKIEISSQQEREYMENYGVVIVDDKVVGCNEGLKQIEEVKFPLIINIGEDDVIRDEIGQTQTAFAWYQVHDRGNFAGNNVSLGHVPAIYFDEYAQVFGNRKLEVTSNYSDYKFFEGKGKESNSNLYAEQASQLLAFLVETNIHLPFTREGTFVINGDRRIKKGCYIYYRPTREVFYVDRVENNISISGSRIDRTTTVSVSRGMVIDYIDGVEEELWTKDGRVVTKNVSYFNIVDIKKLRDGIYDTVNGGSATDKFDYKSAMKVDMDIVNFFLKKKQFKKIDA